MASYTVSDVSEMLNASEESVRRWIRDNKLRAKRGLGRGGNTIYLEDVVSFACHPPRTYLSALIDWLDKHQIPYQVIEDPTPVHKRRTPSESISNVAVGTGIAASLVPLALMNPLTGIAAAGAITAFGAAKNKARPNFRIELMHPSTSDSDSLTIECSEIPKEHSEKLPVLETETVSLTNELSSSSIEENPADIKTKIIDQQMRLVKLKQELAQIQAAIAVAEGEIEYYNLLLEAQI